MILRRIAWARRPSPTISTLLGRSGGPPERLARRRAVRSPAITAISDHDGQARSCRAAQPGSDRRAGCTATVPIDAPGADRRRLVHGQVAHRPVVGVVEARRASRSGSRRAGRRASRSRAPGQGHDRDEARPRSSPPARATPAAARIPPPARVPRHPGGRSASASPTTPSSTTLAVTVSECPGSLELVGLFLREPISARISRRRCRQLSDPDQRHGSGRVIAHSLLEPSLNQGQPPILGVALLGLAQAAESLAEVASLFREQGQLGVGLGGPWLDRGRGSARSAASSSRSAAAASRLPFSSCSSRTTRPAAITETQATTTVARPSQYAW